MQQRGLAQGNDDRVGAASAEVTSNDALAAHLAQAQRHADLGLPVGASVRLRFAKRLVYRVSWLFLSHQVAFNHAMIEANRELTARVAALQERMEQELRDELFDFADRSVSQAHAEIGDYLAGARSVNAELILELRALEADLTAMVSTVTRVSSRGHTPPSLGAKDDGAEIDGDSHESER